MLLPICLVTAGLSAARIGVIALITAASGAIVATVMAEMLPKKTK